MPKVKDRSVIKWMKDGKEITEELVFYDSDDSERELAFDRESGSESCKEEEVELAAGEVERLLAIHILNDFLEKIAIIKCINQKNFKPYALKFPEYKTIEERYGVSIDYGDEFYSESKKRYMDALLIYSVIYKTLEDISTKGHYSSLLEGVKIIKKLSDEEDRFFYCCKNSIKNETELKNKLSTQSKELQEQYNKKMEELHQMELLYEDRIGYGKLEYKYTEAWEASRRHQGKLILTKLENDYTDIINNCELKSAQEMTIHSEIMSYFNETIEEMNAEINYWMDYYDIETESRDSQILRMKMELELQTESKLKLETLYQIKCEFVEYWKGVKEERRIADELLAFQTAVAIKIQAWWRGLMVRKRLGRFRKLKLLKKDQAKKKKKKGKKK